MRCGDRSQASVLIRTVKQTFLHYECDAGVLKCTESPTGSSNVLLGPQFSRLTVITTIAKLLGAWLAHVWPSHRVVHAAGSRDIWWGAEPSGSSSSSSGGRCSLLLLLLLHQHHHALPSHLHGDHLPAALSHHLSVDEARLHKTNIIGGFNVAKA